MIPVRPKEYAIIFDAISDKIVLLLRSPGFYPVNVDLQTSFCSDTMFIGDVDILKDKCNNKYIRNILKTNYLPSSTVFWSTKFKDINWKKVWSITNKFFISNKIKEVSYKILHRIYPVKEVIERFHLNIENLCEFCGVAKESITHLFFDCVYSKMFWVDVSNFISRMCEICIQIDLYDVVFFFVQDIVDSKSKMFFLIQLFILLGKYHIHVKRWTKAKPNFEQYLKEIKQYGITLDKIKNKKARKTHEILCYFKLL